MIRHLLIVDNLLSFLALCFKAAHGTVEQGSSTEVTNDKDSHVVRINGPVGIDFHVSQTGVDDGADACVYGMYFTTFCQAEADVFENGMED